MPHSTGGKWGAWGWLCRIGGRDGGRGGGCAPQLGGMRVPGVVVPHCRAGQIPGVAVSHGRERGPRENCAPQRGRMGSQRWLCSRVMPRWDSAPLSPSGLTGREGREVGCCYPSPSVGLGWDLRPPIIHGAEIPIHEAGAGPPICGVGGGTEPPHPWGWIPSVGLSPPSPRGRTPTGLMSPHTPTQSPPSPPQGPPLPEPFWLSPRGAPQIPV